MDSRDRRPACGARPDEMTRRRADRASLEEWIDLMEERGYRAIDVSWDRDRLEWTATVRRVGA